MLKKLPYYLLFIPVIFTINACTTTNPRTAAIHLPTFFPTSGTGVFSSAPVQPSETYTFPARGMAPTAMKMPIPVNPIQHFQADRKFNVMSIHMIDANLGWAIGALDGLVGDHVLFTADGGSTWRDITPPEVQAASNDHQAATGYFQDEDTAWVIFSKTSGIPPSNPVVWHTQDGGVSWQASQPLDISHLSEFYTYDDMQFINHQYGWLIVHAGMVMNHDYIGLYRTTDGGNSWSQIQDPYNDSSSIMPCSKTHMLFTDTTHGWLTGDCHGVLTGVFLFETYDSGVTWERVRLPEPLDTSGFFTNQLATCGSDDPFFFSNNLGYLSVTCANYDQTPVSYQYFIYTTQDGGKTWSSTPYPGEHLYFMTSDIGWAMGPKIEVTKDGGKTWMPIAVVNWTGQFDFINNKLGWSVAAVGDELFLLKTDDGGAHWTLLEPIVK